MFVKRLAKIDNESVAIVADLEVIGVFSFGPARVVAGLTGITHLNSNLFATFGSEREQDSKAEPDSGKRGANRILATVLCSNHLKSKVFLHTIIVVDS